MLSAFTNSMKIPELRSRIFYTLALLFVARVGAHIPLPGIDPMPLQRFFASVVDGMHDDADIRRFVRMALEDIKRQARQQGVAQREQVVAVGD